MNQNETKLQERGTAARTCDVGLLSYQDNGQIVRPERPSMPANCAGDEAVADWIEGVFRKIAQSGSDTPRLYFQPDQREVFPFAFRDDDSAPAAVRGEAHFAAILPFLIDFYDESGAGGRPAWKQPRSLTANQVRSLYYSPVAAHLLPHLKMVTGEPMAIVEGGGKVRLTDRGFDEATGIFYQCRRAIEPSDSTEHLERLLSGVPFAEGDLSYRNNLIAYLLSAFFYDPFLEIPLLAVSANQPQVGKSKTCEALGILITGKSPVGVQSKEEEMVKQIGARFAAGQRIVFIDNVTQSPYDSAYLAQQLTNGSWIKHSRLLGSSSMLQQAGAMFMLTSNDAQLGPDLLARALPVKLYRESIKKMNPFVVAYAQKHRAEIIAEVLGLATMPMKDQRPVGEDEFPDFRFRSWLDLVLPRVRARFGELQINAVAEMDPSVQELFDTVADRLQGTPFGAAEVKALLSAGNLPAIGARIGRRSGRVSVRAIGHFLKEVAARHPRVVIEAGRAVRLNTEKNPHTNANHYFFTSSDTVPETASPGNPTSPAAGM